MTAMTPLSRNRDYRLLLAGSTIGLVGARMSGIAMPLLAFWLTRSPVQVGLVSAAALIGAVVCGIPAGALVDRWHRGRTIITASLVAAACYGATAGLYYLGRLTVWELAVAGLVTGACQSLIGPASTAALKAVVPADQMGQAMSVNQGRLGVAGLVGPPLGGLVYSVSRALPLLADAVGYLVVAVCVRAVRTPLPAATPTSGRAPVRRAVADGLRFVLGRPAMRSLLLCSATINFAANGFLITLVVTMQQRGVTPAVIGGLEAGMAVAMLVGAVLSERLLGRLAVGRLMVVCSWALVPALLACTLATQPVVVIVALGLGVLGLPALNAGMQTYLMMTTPDEMLGRVQSAMTVTAMSITPLAPLLGGMVLEHGGRVVALSTFLALFLGAALLTTLSRAIRTLPRTASLQPAEASVPT